MILVSDIIEAASIVFGVGEKDIKSHNRRMSVVPARHAVYSLARQLTDLSLPRIGKAVGGRDHSTVSAGLTSCEALKRDWPGYAEKVDIVRRLAKHKARRRRKTTRRVQTIVYKTVQIQTPAGEHAAKRDLTAAMWRAVNSAKVNPNLKPKIKPKPWWEFDDDELISRNVRAHYAAGKDCIEVY